MSEVTELLDYHTGLVRQLLRTIYEQGVRDGRKQASPTKARLLAQIDELERRNAALLREFVKSGENDKTAQKGQI